MMEIDTIEVSDDPDVCNLVGIASTCLVDDETSKNSTLHGPEMLRRLSAMPAAAMRRGKPIEMREEHMEEDEASIGVVTRGQMTEKNELRLWATLHGKTPRSRAVGQRVKQAQREGRPMGLSLGLTNWFAPEFDDKGFLKDMRKAHVQFNECSVVDVPNLPGCIIQTAASDKFPANSPVRYLPPASTEQKETMSSSTENAPGTNPVNPTQQPSSTEPAPTGTPAQPPADWEQRLKTLEESNTRMAREKEEAERVALEERRAREAREQEFAQKTREQQVEAAKTRYAPMLEEGFKNASALAEMMEDETAKRAHTATAAGFKIFAEKPDMLLDEKVVEQLETQLAQTNSTFNMINQFRSQQQQQQHQQQGMQVQTNAGAEVPKVVRHLDAEADLRQKREQMKAEYERKVKALEAKSFMEQHRQQSSSSAANPFNFPFSSSSVPAPQMPDQPMEPEPEHEMVQVYKANSIFSMPILTAASNKKPEELAAFAREGLLEVQTVASNKVREIPQEDLMTISRRWARGVHSKYGRRRKEDLMVTGEEAKDWRSGGRPKGIVAKSRFHKHKHEIRGMKQYGERAHHLVLFDPRINTE